MAGCAEHRNGRSRRNSRRHRSRKRTERERAATRAGSAEGGERERRACDHRQHDTLADQPRRQRSGSERPLLCGTTDANRRRTRSADGCGNGQRAGHRHGPRGPGGGESRRSPARRGTSHVRARSRCTEDQGRHCCSRRRPLQRSLDARHDREPERAKLHADHGLRHAGFPDAQPVPAQADDHGRNDVHGRSPSRHEHGQVRRDGGRLHAHHRIRTAADRGSTEVDATHRRGIAGACRAASRETGLRRNRVWSRADSFSLIDSTASSSVSRPSNKRVHARLRLAMARAGTQGRTGNALGPGSRVSLPLARDTKDRSFGTYADVGRSVRSDHAERVHVGFDDGLVLAALIDILLAQPHDDPQRLHVEAVALGLGVDVLDVVGDRLLLFLQPLHALDEGLELVLRKAGRGLFLFVHGGSDSGHSKPPQVTRTRTMIRRPRERAHEHQNQDTRDR